MSSAAKLGVFFLFKVLLSSVSANSFPWEVTAIQPGNASLEGTPNVFLDLVEGGGPFVDKTLFIKNFVARRFGTQRVLYPPKWGKTTTLKMLETFLGMEVDKEGNMIAPKDTTAYRLFVRGETASGRKVKFKISTEKDLIEKHLAQEPVIFVSFKNVSGFTHGEVKSEIRHALACAYRKHAYLLRVWDEQIARNESWLATVAKFNSKTFNEYMAANSSDFDARYSLKFLMDCLFEHFGRRSYVLLDDHDQPFHSTIGAEYSMRKKDFRSIHDDLTDLLHMSFKDVGSLQQGLITGIYRVVHNSWGSGFDNAEETNMLDTRGCGEYFGFTDHEAQDLLKDEKRVAEVRRFYCGYLVRGGELVVYNPYDVIKYLEHGKVGDYWAQAAKLPRHLFARVAGAESTVISLLNNRTDTRFCSSYEFTSTELLTLSRCIEHGTTTGWLSEAMYLYASGYLTAKSHSRKGHHLDIFLRIPNLENTLSLAAELAQHYSDKHRVVEAIRAQLAQQIQLLPQSKDTTALHKALAEVLFSFPFRNKTNSYRRVHNDVADAFFNLVILVAKLACEDAEVYLYGENDEHDFKRPNLVFKDEGSKVGVVLYLRYDSTNTSLAEADHRGRLQGAQRVRVLHVNVAADRSVKITEFWNR